VYKYVARLRSAANIYYLRFVIFVIIFAIAGFTALLLTKASGNSVSVEIGGGGIQDQGQIVANPSSSSGSFVRFKAPVVVAAGDFGECVSSTDANCAAAKTAQLASTINPDAVFTLGDTIYHFGSKAASDAIYKQTWGIPSLLNKTYPVIGNHEYYYTAYFPGTTPCISHGKPCIDGKTPTDTAAPYWDLFSNRIPPSALGNSSDPSSRKGYYSFNLGNWHIVALNVVCGPPQIGGVATNGGSDNTTQMVPGGCGANSPQVQWLQQDLQSYRAANPNKKCILGIYHTAIKGIYQNTAPYKSFLLPIWQVLYDNGVDVVLNGDNHNYVHYTNLDRSGNAADIKTGGVNNGIEEFVVGTGGAGQTPITGPLSPLAVAAAGKNADIGVLKAQLFPDSFTYDYVPIAGSTFSDSGTIQCH
jgi:Calcineurin-like phosphoesterase